MQHGLRSALLLLLLTACGRVGNPQPPFIRIPEAVKDLTVTQSGNNLVLTWTSPRFFIDGSGATNLSRVQIRSNAEVLATVDALGAGQPQSYAVAVSPVAVGGVRTFTVAVETAQGRSSEVSNIASITPVEVPGRVVKLTPVADQRRIFLQWDKPQEHPEFADEFVVVRTDLPAEAETVKETRYEDSRYERGRSVTYQVTPVRRIGEKAVFGVGPEQVTITLEDKTPPKIPTGLQIQPADSAAYVTWEPNAETDIAGYQLFKSERPDSGFQPVTDRAITNSGFFDPSYRPGLYYAVSAVDEFGNESARSSVTRGQ